jgi:O-antigen ligase
MGKLTQSVGFLREKRLQVLPLLWCLIVFLIPFDRRLLSSVLNLVPVFLIYGAWVLAWRNGPVPNRKHVAGLLAAWSALFLIALARAAAVRHNLPSGLPLLPGDWALLFRDRFERPREMLEAPALVMLSVLLCFRTREIAATDMARMQLPGQGSALLAALSCLFYVSCLLSADPVRSIYLFAREGGLYLPLAQVLLLWAAEARSIRPILKPLCYTGLALAVAALLVCLWAALGGRETRLWMAAEPREWIRWDYTAATHRYWRLQFPLGHHNRAASYFLLVTFTSLALFAQTTHKRLSQSSAFSPRLLLVLLPLAALLITKTRGAYVATAVGAVVMFTVAGYWRRPWAWCILVAGCALVFILPGPRKQALSVFRSQTYTQRGDTLYLRYAGWRAACGMIRSHPILGIGYGSEVFEKVYLRDYKELYKDPEKKSHCHNNFLEVAAESGLPALGLFLWLNILVLRNLWRWRLRVDGLPALLGLFAAVHTYGMANYNLRQGIGFLLWGLLSLLLAVVADSDSEHVSG